MSHTMNLLYVTYSSIWNLLQLLYMRDRRGETAIDDIDDGNDNDDHNLPSVYLSIDPTIYPSITVIHLSRKAVKKFCDDAAEDFRHSLLDVLSKSSVILSIDSSINYPC